MRYKAQVGSKPYRVPWTQLWYSFLWFSSEILPSRRKMRKISPPFSTYHWAQKGDSCVAVHQCVLCMCVNECGGGLGALQEFQLVVNAWSSIKDKFRAAQVAQWFSTAFSPGPYPGDLGSSPTSGSLHGACFSFCLCLCLSLSLSLSLSAWINKNLKKNLFSKKRHVKASVLPHLLQWQGWELWWHCFHC